MAINVYKIITEKDNNWFIKVVALKSSYIFWKIIIFSAKS